MRVYVAGNPKLSSKKIAEAMRKIRAGGHYITRDWLAAIKRGETDRADAAYWDKEGVLACDVFVLIDSEQGWGMYTELGIALATNKHILIFKPCRKQVFYSLPQVKYASNLGEMMKFINNPHDYNLKW